ncbi:hypothetical protein V5799_025546 [Amblyomma americanum]|uniref:Uncharacterized protein n=1 Tax=Amblyomma americanum TaxID=6943 RepID=A0AAQ4E8Y7_AMBAM
MEFVARDDSVSGPPPGYHLLLPTLPSHEGMHLRGRRPEGYQRHWCLGDEPPLDREFVHPGGEGRCICGRGPSMKGGYCAIIDPCQKEIKVKIHCVLFHISSETLRKALSEFEEVMEIRHEEWNVPGFGSAESTTRVAGTVLKERVTVEELPYFFKFYGGSVLVVVP